MGRIGAHSVAYLENHDVIVEQYGTREEALHRSSQLEGEGYKVTVARFSFSPSIWFLEAVRDSKAQGR